MNKVSFEEKNTLHSLAPYVGKIRQDLVHKLIMEYAVPEKYIYDPFCGSGTVLLEGWAKGYNVIGSDVSEYAYLLSKAKLNPHTDVNEIEATLEVYNKNVNQILENGQNTNPPSWICSFFHPETLKEITSWVKVLSEARDWHFLASLLGILHHQRPGYLSYPSSNSTPYLRDKKYPLAEYPEMYEYKNVYERLRKKILRTIKCIPSFDEKLDRRVLKRDSSSIRPLDNVGTIITSPPYMKALSYARDNRMRLWFLGIEDWNGLDKVISPSKDIFLRTMKTSVDMWSNMQKKGDRCIVIVGDMVLSKSVGTKLSDYVVSLANSKYKLLDEYYDPIPESKKVIKGNSFLLGEKIIAMERK